MSHIRPNNDEEGKHRLRSRLVEIIDAFRQSQKDIRHVHGDENGDADISQLRECDSLAQTRQG